MRVETGLVSMTLAEQPTVEKIGGGGGGERPSNKKKKKRRQKKLTPVQIAPPTAIQRLYDTCKEVFSGSSPGVVPSRTDVERIRCILDSMKPEDVGLTHSLSFLENDFVGAPPVVYLHICGSDKFSIGIFCLRPSAVIPLHNHPGMTVFSKLLFGSMHIKSYDWADHQNCDRNEQLSQSCPAGARLAKVVTNAVFTAPCNTSILYPAAGGNMHCFTAVTSCAVLDVLGPDYCDSEGRHCAYYNVSCSQFSGEGKTATGNSGEYACLVETEKPDTFLVGGVQYTGPPITDG